MLGGSGIELPVYVTVSIQCYSPNRHLLLFNSKRQRLIATILQILIIMFTLFTVCVAVLYNYYSQRKTSSSQVSTIQVLLKLNLILPLVTTVFRGVNSAMSPSTKAVLLKKTSIKIESEIYMYRYQMHLFFIHFNNHLYFYLIRTKVGPYCLTKLQASTETNKKKTDKENDKANNEQKSSNPRKILSSALDSMWTDLAASDISKSGLVQPLGEITCRLCINFVYRVFQFSDCRSIERHQ